ncbi:hypothetical protein PTSG_03122 [Salpingoeca rosetta]|uniref:hydroxyacylglutathione hydrolase n=1 Tax=Salpingoeca rosetta (strain ATCC 50818 / BSB-021) TaxID=946362 RepID=F2U4A7_SALR5|nr:uncharacterized protein PTSG_03122 [Salpingoeca rosetta]EGD82473.1 hypothetical protein PTSG_03122 [Salpingoeca rosetta]|eukprot:XP_004995709.1 hypothetical protein PTSG_03122 [Salpingoeca rosetta]
MEAVVVPLLSDNYGYLLVDKATREAAAIDPVEPKKVLAAAEENNADIKYVLTTHSHWDHAGGNAEFKRLRPSVTIFGGRGDGADAVDQEVWDDDSLDIGSIKVSVLATPCHTPGHVCYYATAGDDRAVFTGDTLFIGGCGNFNQGTPQMMYDALYTKLGRLPDDTRVYVGHEYTVKNLTFARVVEPDNRAVQEKLAWAEEQRQAGQYTVPSTIGEEKAFNPFMRCHETPVHAYCGTADAVTALATVRERKTAWGRVK